MIPAKNLSDIACTEKRPLTGGNLHGLERESLRVNANGELSQSPHPEELGSSLTHPFITTDFSESQIEFTTGVRNELPALLRDLEQLQRFTLEVLQARGERLWPLSMPGRLPAEKRIPIADYGASEAGRRKTIYRRGLAHRYGKRMQMISGVHYNFSLGRECWRGLLHAEVERLEAATDDPLQRERGLRDLIDAAQFGMIRNFLRCAWFFSYLFGASPALDKSYRRPEDENRDDPRLSSLDRRSLYGKYATSLRLSDIGYTNQNQRSLYVSYNSLNDYIRDMCRAVSTPEPAYRAWKLPPDEMLNDRRLQIENEHYAVIRPKQTPGASERPLTALEERGVGYLEMRCLDLAPFHPAGIDQERMAFAHMALLHCLLESSPPLERGELRVHRKNQLKVAWQGRKPGLKIQSGGRQLRFADAGLAFCEALESIARTLDAESASSLYTNTLQNQAEKFRDPERTPSAQMLQHMRDMRAGYVDYGLDLARRHEESLLEQKLPAAERRRLQTASRESLREFRRLETAPAMNEELPPRNAAPAVCGKR